MTVSLGVFILGDVSSPRVPIVAVIVFPTLFTLVAPILVVPNKSSSILSKAHLGYLHLVRASLRHCISWLRSSCLVQRVLALCVRVLMTLYLANR